MKPKREVSLSEKEKEYIEFKKDICKSKRTPVFYQQLIERLIWESKTHLADIDYESFRNFLKGLNSQAMKNNYIVLIKNYHKEMELDLNKKIARMKTHKPNINHVKRKEKLIHPSIYEFMIKKCVNPEYKCLIEILYYTGFRISEVLSIKVKGVKVTDKCIKISCMESKTFPREVPIYETMGNTLDFINIHHKTKNPNDKLFSISQMGIYKFFQRFFDDIGIKHYTPHDFRHTRATELCRMKHHERAIKEFMGWTKSSQMLEYYNHNRLDDYAETMEEKYNVKSISDMEKENKTLNQELKNIKENMQSMIQAEIQKYINQNLSGN